MSISPISGSQTPTTQEELPTPDITAPFQLLQIASPAYYSVGVIAPIQVEAKAAQSVVLVMLGLMTPANQGRCGNNFLNRMSFRVAKKCLLDFTPKNAEEAKNFLYDLDLYTSEDVYEGLKSNRFTAAKFKQLEELAK